ncbi:MAG: hypothetical protein KTR15_06075 [Phycisphaeraceae bacterium]|nr:hypothetical protein [Phycisphaeraceae bacterium]
MGLQEIRYWFEDLELRKKLEENQSVAVVGLLVVIIFCLGLVMCQLTGGGPGSSTREFKLVYFDVDSQTIKIVDHKGPAQAASPLEGTDNVFIASVFACEACPEGQIKDGMNLDDLKAEGMFIAWLERIDPNMTDEMAMFGEGRSYRTLENDRWYKTTEKGYELINKRLLDRCPKARICRP